MAQNYSNKSSRNRSRSNAPAPETAAVESILIGLGQVIAWIFRALFAKGGSKGKAYGNTAQLAALQGPWEEVELHVLQESTRSIAISEADKILDNALRILGASGDTMADRLRSFENRFGSDLYQQIWHAHKLRNTLAHEIGARVSSEEAQSAVTIFRKALYQLGVLS